MELSTRQLQIVQSAGKLLSAGGIGNLTTKRLAEEMKFSEAALYRHFKSKNDIIYAMLNYLADSMSIRIESIINTTDSAEDKITNLFMSQFIFFSKNQHYLNAIFSDGLWEQNKQIHTAVLKVMNTKKEHLDIIFSEGIANDEFNSTINKDSLIHITMGTFRLHMLKWKMNDFSFNVVTSGEKIIADLIQLLKK